jgi:hypothetical protein
MGQRVQEAVDRLAVAVAQRQHGVDGEGAAILQRDPVDRRRIIRLRIDAGALEVAADGLAVDAEHVLDVAAGEVGAAVGDGPEGHRRVAGAAAGAAADADIQLAGLAAGHRDGAERQLRVGAGVAGQGLGRLRGGQDRGREQQGRKGWTERHEPLLNSLSRRTGRPRKRRREAARLLGFAACRARDDWVKL